MSTLNNSLSTMKNDESQENNFLYTNEIIEQMSNDERRNSSCDLMKKIYPSDFRSWSIFNLLKPEFIKQIRMVMVYGDYANKALVVTKNKNVYNLDYDRNNVYLNDKNADTHIGIYSTIIKELCGKNIKTFAHSTYFMLALTEEGELYYWRLSKKLKMKDRSYASIINIQSKPTRIVGLCEKRIVDIACGSNHFLALTSNGEVYSWGEDKNGQFGNKNFDFIDISLPKQVIHKLRENKIVHIACGSNFNMVVTDMGKLYGWGNNENCQILMNNVTSTASTSTASTSTASTSTVSTYTASTASTSTASTSTPSKPKPTVINIPIPVSSIFNSKTIVNPTLNNTSFSFAFPNPITVPSPIGFSSVKSISSTNKSPSHFTFGSVNKTILNNVEQQTYYVHPHEIVVFGKEIVKVACGSEHTLALTNEGKIYAWGKNINGQVGGMNRQISSQTLVTYDYLLVSLPEMEKVLDIAAYGNLSVAVSNNKTVYVWGNFFGQDIYIPYPTGFSRIDDAFAYSKSKIMYKPLIVSTDDYEYVEEVLNVMESLEAAFDNQTTSDCIVQVEEKRIHVHRVILQIRSQYFKNKFQYNWNDKKKDEPIIYIASEKFSYTVYNAFLKYLYTGKVDLSSKDALDLLQLADEYDETNLKRECSRIIQQEIAVSNVALYYSKAIEFKAKELEEFCLQFAFCHMKDVILSEEYIKLDVIIKDIFMRKAAETNVFRT